MTTNTDMPVEDWLTALWDAAHEAQTMDAYTLARFAVTKGVSPKHAADLIMQALETIADEYEREHPSDARVQTVWYPQAQGES